jgi:hypothetical protein
VSPLETFGTFSSRERERERERERGLFAGKKGG